MRSSARVFRPATMSHEDGPSTNEERTPLLAESAALEVPTSRAPSKSNACNKLLLVPILGLFLLASVFVGLFAGAQNKLDPRNDAPSQTATATVTITTSTTSVGTAYPPMPTDEPNEEPCLKPECIHLAASILSSLDTSLDPCEDFYDFATRGWVREHPLPPGRDSISPIAELRRRNELVMRNILESGSMMDPEGQFDHQVLRKLRDLYNSCMDENELDLLGVTPLLKVTRRIRELFRPKTMAKNMTNEKQESHGLTASIVYLHNIGVPVLFKFDVAGDYMVDPNDMALWLTQPEFGLPSKDYFNDTSVTIIYQRTIEHFLVELQDKGIRSTAHTVTTTTPSLKSPVRAPAQLLEDRDEDHDRLHRSNFTRLAENVISLEKKIAAASLSLDVLHLDPLTTYNPISIDNLTATFPAVDFHDYFAASALQNVPQWLIVTSPAYISSLQKIIKEEKQDVLEAYLVSRAAFTFAPYLGRKTNVWRAYRSLDAFLRGTKFTVVEDRAQYCVGDVESALGFAIGRYFSNITFGEDAQRESTKIIAATVEVFKNSLRTLDWMDKESALAAAQKASNTEIEVGYPLSPDTRDAEAIFRYYEAIEIDENDFFGNMLSSRRSEVTKTWQKLGKRRDSAEWRMFPSESDAYFDFLSVKIVVPAGELQPPNFDQSWPGYLAYSTLGALAAHELTHAFDSTGRLYNQNGKLEEWWTNSTSQAFRTRQNCIADQYSKYYVKDADGHRVYLDGNITSENIADNGIIQAFHAWRVQYVDSHQAGKEYTLPGLNYTREQLFFIGYAQSWAGRSTPAAEVQRVRTSLHAPHRFRVEGPLSNMPDFGRAFNCSATARLNPPMEKRCIFWE